MPRLLVGCLLWVLVFPAFSSSAAAAELAPFVIPWDDVAPGPMDLSGLNDTNLTRISIGPDGHLNRNGKRYRLWGINFGWAVCFLTHHQADVIAARIAKFGINAVRLHGCDKYGGASLIDYGKGTSRTLQSEGLDKFDYFVSQLQKHGIYVDINLYVGRRFLPGDGPNGQPLPVPAPTANENFDEDTMQWHKHLGFVYDPIRELHKEYASQLLSHVNPYTSKAYATDPGVAFVEILNEGGLVHYWLWGRLDQYPQALQLALQEKWNRWLSARPGYTSTAALLSAWDMDAAPEEKLANSAMTAPLEPWILNVMSPAAATMAPDASDAAHPGVRIDVTAVGPEAYSVQLLQQHLALELGQSFTVSFWARASSQRNFQFSVQMDGGTWANLTPYSPQAPSLSTDWQQYQVVFTLSDPVLATSPIRFNIEDLGRQTGTVWISAPSVKSGGSTTLTSSESLEAGTIPNLRKNPSRPFSLAAQRDWVTFLRDTESSFYDDILAHLRTKVGLQAPVVGSQVGIGTPSASARLDIVDVHSYWDLTQFPPGLAWNPDRWQINNQSSILSPPGVLRYEAMGRIAGKPYVMTETGTNIPNDYVGEGAITLGAYVGLHDLDAVFPFGWANQQITLEESCFTYYADLGYHPGLLSSLFVGGLLFRTFDVSPSAKTWQVSMDPATEVDTLLTKGQPWQVADASLRGFPLPAALHGRPELVLTPGATNSTFPDVTGLTSFAAGTGELLWDTAAKNVQLHSARARGVVGFTDGGRFALGDPNVDCAVSPASCIVFEPGTTRLGFSSLVLSLVEGTSFTGKGRAILTAVGEVANSGMKWNATRTSLGSSWGGPPTLIEPVPATITLPRAASEVRGFALDGRGQRIEELLVTGDAGHAVVKVGSGVPTVWYELALGSVADPAGEVNATLTTCADHCATVGTIQRSCYPTTAACLAECAYFVDKAAAGACDCTDQQRALFTCLHDKGAPAMVCGGLLDTNLTGPCADQALTFERCMGNRYPCGDWSGEVLDDFEDGDANIQKAGFAQWLLVDDANVTLAPTTFVTARGGVHGSAGQFALTATRAVDATTAQLTGFGFVIASAAQTVDLSRYAGIGFFAKGNGRVRVQLPTESMNAAGNWDAFGRDILLHADWTWHSVLFGDPDFRQAGWGAPATFDPKDVDSLQFSVQSKDLTLSLDDVTLLRDPNQGCGDGGCADAIDGGTGPSLPDADSDTGRDAAMTGADAGLEDAAADSSGAIGLEETGPDRTVGDGLPSGRDTNSDVAGTTGTATGGISGAGGAGAGGAGAGGAGAARPDSGVSDAGQAAGTEKPVCNCALGSSRRPALGGLWLAILAVCWARARRRPRGV